MLLLLNIFYTSRDAWSTAFTTKVRTKNKNKFDSVLSVDDDRIFYEVNMRTVFESLKTAQSVD